MSDELEAKKPVSTPKPRPRNDLNHERYSGIAWCQHGINEDFCATCKKEKVRIDEARLAKAEAKLKAKKPKVAKAAPKKAEEPAEEEIEVRVEG